MSISEEIKSVKVKKSATFIPLSAKKDGQISKLAEAQQREAKLQEEELQENTYAFQQAKRADKASKNAMRFPRDHKDHEEAYTAHSDAHEAALSAAGHTGGYAYGSNNGMSHKMKQKYLKMASDHLDHMIHHTNKEFGTQESVQENVKDHDDFHVESTVHKDFEHPDLVKHHEGDEESKNEYHSAVRKRIGDGPLQSTKVRRTGGWDSDQDIHIHHNPKTKKTAFVPDYDHRDMRVTKKHADLKSAVKSIKNGIEEHEEFGRE